MTGRMRNELLLFENIIVIGGSAGSFEPLQKIFSQLPKDFALPIILVIHRAPDYAASLSTSLANCSKLAVVEVKDKQEITPGKIFVAPYDYHLLIEDRITFSLSQDAKLHYCRPSIDILFASAAEVFGNNCCGILLSGANSDGAQGLLDIKQRGGLSISQSPESSQFDVMPLAAIKLDAADAICDPQKIVSILLNKANN